MSSTLMRSARSLGDGSGPHPVLVRTSVGFEYLRHPLKSHLYTLHAIVRCGFRRVQSHRGQYPHAASCDSAIGGPIGGGSHRWTPRRAGCLTVCADRPDGHASSLRDRRSTIGPTRRGSTRRSERPQGDRRRTGDCPRWVSSRPSTRRRYEKKGCRRRDRSVAPARCYSGSRTTWSCESCRESSRPRASPSRRTPQDCVWQGSTPRTLLRMTRRHRGCLTREWSDKGRRRERRPRSPRIARSCRIPGNPPTARSRSGSNRQGRQLSSVRHRGGRTRGPGRLRAGVPIAARQSEGSQVAPRGGRRRGADRRSGTSGLSLRSREADRRRRLVRSDLRGDWRRDVRFRYASE